LLAIRTDGQPDPAGRIGIGKGLLGAVTYAAETPPVAFTLGLMIVVSLLVLNFNVVVPLVARDMLKLGAHGFGLLMSALGVGAVAGMTPFGSLLVGTIAEHLGVRVACAAGGAAGLLGVAVIVLVAHRAGLAWRPARAT